MALNKPEDVIDVDPVLSLSCIAWDDDSGHPSTNRLAEETGPAFIRSG